MDRLDPESMIGLRLAVRDVAERDYLAGRCDNALALLERARRSADPVVIAEALSVTHHCMLGPEHHAARLQLAEELLAIGSFTGRPIDTAMGLLWRTVDLYLIGDVRADRSLRELKDRVDQLGHAALMFVVKAIEVMRKVRSGQFDQAENLANECYATGRTAGDDDGIGWLGAHVGVIRWYQGRSDELVDLFDELMPSPTLADANLAFVAGFAVSAAARGDKHRAGAALHRLRGRALADMPSSSTSMVQLIAAIQAARLLTDVEVVAEAYDLLRPYADLPVMASLAVACFGSTHYWLGIAADFLGQTETAVMHLRLAVESNDVMGHAPARVLSRLELAGALARRRQPGDAAAAEVQRRMAEEEVRTYGMQRWLSVAYRTGSISGAVCVRSGSDWHLSAFGVAVEVKDSIGMRYLSVLIANPDTEIRAADLASGSEQRPPEKLRQPVLDEAALRALRDRLAALRQAEDLAILTGDRSKAEKMRTEYEWIEQDLRRARGLGGRLREFSGDDERARVAVQKAIKRALDTITAVDSHLGGQLNRAIVTGAHCMFRTH